MVLLLAALALAQEPDFGLPGATVKPVNDRMVGMLDAARTSRTRGFLVSSDGDAAFTAEDNRVRAFHFADGYINSTNLYVRKTDPKSPLYTELQRRVVQGESGPDWDWMAVDVAALLRAPNAHVLTLAYNAGHGCGVATVDLQSNDVADNKALFIGTTKAQIYGATPDAGSDEVVMDLTLDATDRDSVSFYALLDGKKFRESKPGWAPMLFDRKRNRFVTYTYSESGFPGGIDVFPVVGDGKDVRMGFPEQCMLYLFAQLPDGRYIGYFAPRDEELVEKHAGTYVWDMAGNAWAKACPYELIGASPDGKALLFSDRHVRKSWIVMPKG